MHEAVGSKMGNQKWLERGLHTNLRPSNWSLPSSPTCFLANFQLDKWDGILETLHRINSGGGSKSATSRYVDI
jgi:hypothetical protein